MPQSQIIIHERLGTWARQLRPRFPGWPIHWSESRSASSLVKAVRLSYCPILLIDLADRPLRGLEDLSEAMQASPGGLSVVLDPSNQLEVAIVARELGATLVLGGVVVPPVVETLLRRWIPIAIQRVEREGWSKALEPEPESSVFL
jgi:hypothetical protein